MPISREQLAPTLGVAYDQIDSLGDYFESVVVQGSAVALTSTTVANVTTLTLPAGDWDISGTVGFIPAASTSITRLSGGSSSTSATVDTTGTAFAFNQAAVVPTAVPQLFALPTDRLVLAAPTTIYLVAQATFTVSTLGAFGIITARRCKI